MHLVLSGSFLWEIDPRWVASIVRPGARNWTVVEQILVLYQGMIARFIITGADRLHHALVVFPNFLQIFIPGINIQANRLICLPIGL